MTPDRYRAWVAHCAGVEANAGHRIRAAGGHDHRRGWQACAICGQPADHRRCGLDDCAICGSHAERAAQR